MGAEFGQWSEWKHDFALEWDLLQWEDHIGLRRWVEMLNRQYAGERALHDYDCDPGGFEWIDANDADRSVLSFLRKCRHDEEIMLVVCNFTPSTHHNYLIGVPRGGYWRETANSDAKEYGGTGHGNMGGTHAAPVPMHGRPYSLSLTLPPLAAIFLRCEGGPE
jgi:1,4-alpha-glucan branching enzyme